MPRKVRLLFIPYTMTNGGGAEKVLALLVNSLDPRKYDIRIQEVARYDNAIALNASVRMGRAFYGMGKSFFQRAWRKTAGILLCHAPVILKALFGLSAYDAVITFNYQLPSFMLPAFTRQKKIAWFHGDIFDLQREGKRRAKGLQRKAWAEADAIVTISQKSLASLQSVFPEYYEKTRIVHNGIDVEHVRLLARESCPFDFGDIPSLICVGRLDKNKNYALVIQALAELRKRGVRCRLLLAGQGELENDLRRLAEALSVADSVCFLGYQANPYPYVARSAAACISSLSEGWPLTAMEAMALGIPFVTTPVSGASEELSDGGRCGLVSDYEPGHYADALEQLLADEKLYRRMSENCRVHVQDYSVAQYVAGFEKLLSDVGVRQ